ncbi:MAG: hypothetical protein IKH57_17875 [Clostridia bacterium]|nr:hypothetical protein [Clostridia bacterium]
MKEYSVSVAVADAPLGPYVKQVNNPLLMYTEDETGVTVSGPGHNAFFTVGDELFTSYHTHTYPQAPSGSCALTGPGSTQTARPTSTAPPWPPSFGLRRRSDAGTRCS